MSHQHDNVRIKTMKSIIFFVIVLSGLFLAIGLMGSSALAHGGGGSGDAHLHNPLGPDTNTIMDVIQNIIVGLRDKIAPPIVAMMVLYGGFQMLFAGGVPETFSKGRKTILYAVVGYAIIFIASGISAIITDILSAYDLFDNYIT